MIPPMALVDCTPEVPDLVLPARIESMLDDADARIRQYQGRVRYQPAGGFLASDFNRAYATLRRLKTQIRGRRFCEWGAGLGVVAGLAAQLGYESYGIEVQADLVREGHAFLDAHHLDATLVHGTIVAESSQGKLHADAETFLNLDAPDGFAALGFEPGEFDVTYVYAWPHEENLVVQLFDLQASPGNLLVTYQDDEQLKVFRRE